MFLFLSQQITKITKYVDIQEMSISLDISFEEGSAMCLRGHRTDRLQYGFHYVHGQIFFFFIIIQRISKPDILKDLTS